LKHTGAFIWVKESHWRAEKLLILCYHGISLEDEHEWRPGFSMTASVFESRLEMLRAGGYSVLPLGEVLRKLYSHTLPPKSVAITFDDGLYNFYARAFPLLQKYNYPATLYLTTYYCFRNQPVFPLICSYMLWKKRGVVVPSNPSLGFSKPLDLSTSSGRFLAWKEITAHAERNTLNADQKNELAKGLAEHLNLDFDNLASKRLFHLMTPEEIKEISKKGVDIQLHTHRHRSPLDRYLYQQEIIENRSKIAELTGKRARHFCYPSGVYRTQFLPWLSEQGVSSATTCDVDLANAKSNPLLLPRFLDSSNVSTIEFESWLTGVGALIPRNPLHRQ
jgi:peptidoglycan/xylan/chitin deacetylase (PgdA/CDA1 family)